ncbi:hypothetical protein G6F43_012623 [Rhizopus delemar]|nr:hypothetical protein G6F43_012623 [Rhizopus delemar]
MHGESASVDISSENIQNELRKIKELLEPYDPVDIMNFDETGLYYQQPPRRIICSSESLDGLKKSKTRLTVELLYNLGGTYKGQPIAMAQDKSPECFEARANLLSMTAIRKKHEIEHHYSTDAWMTAYVKKLNVAFGRQNRKIALLLVNAFVHKIRIPLNDIKLIFLLTNTTSKLQALDAGSLLFFGIIASFKAHFRAQQYDRALCLYISKNLDNLDVYKMDQAQAMFFLSNARLKVKPETIKNCWQHTKILAFKEKTICDFEPVEYPTSALPLEKEIVAELNGMIPDLPRKFNNEVTDVSQLNLEADESDMIKAT